MVTAISQYQWSQFHNKKTQISRMDTKSGFIFLLYTRNIKNRHHLRVKNWEEIFQANGTKKQSSIVLLISNKKDFKPKIIKRDGEEYYTHTSKENFKMTFQFLLTSVPQTH